MTTRRGKAAAAFLGALIGFGSNVGSLQGAEKQRAVLAGGCFWCMEPPFDELPGVVSTTSGYTGGRTKIWDTCGPEAILAAAGGRMTDVDGNPLVYDRPDLYNRRGIVASNGPLHDFVISALVPIVAMS